MLQPNLRKIHERYYSCAPLMGAVQSTSIPVLVRFDDLEDSGRVESRN